MKHVRGFLLSSAFAGLVLLAFNPHLTVKIQEGLGFPSAYDPAAPLDPNPVPPAEAAADIAQKNPLVLPTTPMPDTDNLPRLSNYKSIPKHDPWIGETSCGREIFNPPERLPGLGPRKVGPVLSQPMTTLHKDTINNQPTSLYKSRSGVTLKLVLPLVKYYDVSGRRYKDAQNDIFDRQPLRTLREAKADYSPDIYNPVDESDHNEGLRSAIVGDIFSPTTLTYGISGARDRFRIRINQTVLTSAFIVTLPRWENYDTASAADKAKWDDFFCNAAHHELGHLRIRLDMTAETLEGYANLPPAYSFDEMKAYVIDYQKDIDARIDERQAVYHIYNGGGSRRGMIELPYAELPFPWLKTQSHPIKTVEQSPE